MTVSKLETITLGQFKEILSKLPQEFTREDFIFNALEVTNEDNSLKNRHFCNEILNKALKKNVLKERLAGVETKDVFLGTHKVGLFLHTYYQKL